MPKDPHPLNTGGAQCSHHLWPNGAVVLLIDTNQIRVIK